MAKLGVDRSCSLKHSHPRRNFRQQITARHPHVIFSLQVQPKPSVHAEKGVEIRADEAAAQIIRARAATKNIVIKAATEEDWYEEYLAPIISIKVVDGVDEAIAHINKYSSHHTDAIITTNHVHAQKFLREVDSASVMVNASTRFADGFEFGLGAEIGISTDKFHARGPVGIEGLTSLKYVVLGDGEVRG